MYSSESSGFSFTLEQGKDVSLSDGALHVSHQASVGVVHECHLHLSDASSGAYTLSLTSSLYSEEETARDKRLETDYQVSPNEERMLTGLADDLLDCSVCDFSLGVHIDCFVS